MAANADLAVPRDPVREYQDLMAAIGRMVAGAATGDERAVVGRDPGALRFI